MLVCLVLIGSGQSSECDIDLLIDFEPEKENFNNFMAVYDLLEEIFKNEKIEVGTKNGLSLHDCVGVNQSIVWDVMRNKIPDINGK